MKKVEQLPEDKIIAELNKEGDARLSVFGAEAAIDWKPKPTGIITLDYSLGGGLAEGTFSELYGPSGSGKTTVVKYMIRAAQRRGERCLYVNGENAFDAKRALELGIRKDGSLMITNQRIIERLFGVIVNAIRELDVTMVFIDSLFSLVSDKEYGKKEDLSDALDGHAVGIKAKMLGRFINLLNEENNSRANIVMVNQIREDPGVMMGDPTVTPGGKAPEFFSHQRVRFRPAKKIDVGTGPNKITVGVEIAYNVVKSRVAPSYQPGNFKLLFKDGINQLDELITVGLLTEKIIQRGAVYDFCGQSVRGRDGAFEVLEKNPDLVQQLVELLNVDYNAYFGK